MSKKFMILMLVVFGGLLYAVSFALHKQQEPPPPPTSEQLAEQKKMQDDEMKMRMQEMERMRNMQKSQKGAPTLSDAAIKSIATNRHLPLPPQPAHKPTGRGPTDTVIKADWFHDHSDGAAGIEQEIKEREKNARPAPKPQLIPAGDAPAAQPLGR